MKFEWSPAKAKLNLQKHGIAFEEAVGVFDRPYIEGPDDREDYGEDRIILLGEVNARVVVLIYTWRGESRRVISARKATRQEREAHYAEIGGGRPS